jgi:predicted nucleotidyltransferase
MVRNHGHHVSFQSLISNWDIRIIHVAGIFKMEKQDLIQLLDALDKQLSKPLDLVIIGGAAMILHYQAQRATRDVDALILRGDLNEFRAAVKSVANENHLSDDWLNDAVKGFTDILPPDFYHRLVPLSLNFQQLQVYALGLPEQTAMKIVALREQDLEDLELLLTRLTETDKKILVQIMLHVSRFRPDWAQKIQYFLQEQGWQLE